MMSLLKTTALLSVEEVDPEIISVVVDTENDQVIVTFTSLTGATYAVERSTTLESALWEELDDSVVAADATHTYLDPGAPSSGEPKYFYTVTQVEAP